jgi:hydroxymethylpyrimidine pyrophosphatase-like HAD family hydrolase
MNGRNHHKRNCIVNIMKYNFLQWIDINKLDMKGISTNEKSFHFFETHPDKIGYLSHRPEFIHIIEKNLHIIDWQSLSSNTNAIHILSQNIDKINWWRLSFNTAAITIWEQNLDKVIWENITLLEDNDVVNFISKYLHRLSKEAWRNLSSNPVAIEILKNNLDKIDINQFSLNPNAIEILDNDPEKICFCDLYFNQNPDAWKLFLKYPEYVYSYPWFFASSYHILPLLFYYKEHDPILFDYLLDFELYENENPDSLELIEYHMKLKPELINWDELSAKSFTVHIMEQHIDKINWIEFSKLPEAIHILEKHIDKIHWTSLSSNPAAIHILKENQDKIDWVEFSKNDGIYEEISIIPL